MRKWDDITIVSINADILRLKMLQFQMSERFFNSFKLSKCTSIQ